MMGTSLLDLTGGCRSLPDSQARRAMTRRARSLSIGQSDRVLSSSASAAILFKDSNGQPVVQHLHSSGRSTPEDDILNFFKCYKCYDLIPTSAKLVVLDTELVLKKAFFAMVDTGVRACPLWDSEKQQFVGMLTITDFIRILQSNYKGPEIEMEAFEEQRLIDWKGITEQKESLISVSPSASLYEAVWLLIKNKIHRLPVVDPNNGNVLYILNQKPLLRFLYHYVPHLANSRHLSSTIIEARVGSFDNVQVAKETTTIIEALNKFVRERISALPIVDDAGHLISIYSKFDVINLAAEKTYEDLEVTLKEASSHKSSKFEEVLQCRGEDTVLTVMERLVMADVNRLVVVDDEQKVIGLVTVSDVIYFLVLRHSLPAVRGKKVGGREDSLGEEEEEEEEEEDQTAQSNMHQFSKSCSPPRWFHV